MEKKKSYTFEEAFEASKKYFDGDEMEVKGKTYVYTYTGTDQCEGCDLAEQTKGGCPDCACGFVWKEKKDAD